MAKVPELVRRNDMYQWGLADGYMRGLMVGAAIVLFGFAIIAAVLL